MSDFRPDKENIAFFRFLLRSFFLHSSFPMFHQWSVKSLVSGLRLSVRPSYMPQLSRLPATILRALRRFFLPQAASVFAAFISAFAFSVAAFVPVLTGIRGPPTHVRYGDGTGS